MFDEKLSEARRESESALIKARGVYNTWKSKREEVLGDEDDPLRPSTKAVNALEKLRAPALEAIAKEFSKIKASTEYSDRNEQFLSDPFVQLSQEKFSPSPSEDWAIRQRVRQEFAVMPPEKIALLVNRAASEGRLAYGYEALLAQQSRAKDPGWIPVDLSGVEIPGQERNLANLKNCQAARVEAETMFSEISGGPRKAATDRMNFGRLQREAARLDAAARKGA